MNWLRRASDGTVTLTIHAQPGAKRTEVAGIHGEALKIRLAGTSAWFNCSSTCSRGRDATQRSITP